MFHMLFVVIQFHNFIPPWSTKRTHTCAHTVTVNKVPVYLLSLQARAEGEARSDTVHCLS